jgi:hypothetical protein
MPSFKERVGLNTGPSQGLPGGLNRLGKPAGLSIALLVRKNIAQVPGQGRSEAGWLEGFISSRFIPPPPAARVLFPDNVNSCGR